MNVMKLVKLVSAVSLVSIIIGSPGSAAQQRKPRRARIPPRKETVVLTVSSRQRSGELFVPAHAPSESLPLVVVLHGGNGSGKTMESYTGFTQLAGSQKFAVVYPDGIDGNWNDGRDNPRSTASRENINDVLFIRTLVEKIVVESNLDRSRVFATGMSNGGFMSIRLACDTTGIFAGVAAVSGTAPIDFAQHCQSSDSMPILQIHGDADPLAPYEGGAVKFGRQQRGDVVSVDALADFFVKRNGCDPSPAIGSLADTSTGDGSTISTRTWSNCTKNVPTVFWRVVGGGHTWPSERRSLPAGLVGTTNTDVDATAEIWKFFSAIRP